MRHNGWMILGLVGVASTCVAMPAHAQTFRAGTGILQGPTTNFSVPRAYVRPGGNNLVGTTLYLGSQGAAGLPTNALGLRAEMGMGGNFQLDTGIAAITAVPWRGYLSMAGKWGFLREGGPALASISGMFGGLLAVDANGIPSLGLQFGLPISKMFVFNRYNSLNFSLVPAFNLGVWNAAALIPGGAWPYSSSFVSLGLGADFAFLPNLHLIGDTTVGIPGITGVGTQNNLGIRWGITPSVVVDLFVGANGTGLGLGTLPASLGLSAHWAY
ncbi:MAG TPA: hypothetical protein V6D05_07545 [Stenomitos sp.]